MVRIRPTVIRKAPRALPTLAVLAILLLLALVLTYPLPLAMGTHAPGDGSDDPAILWNLWWVRYSLTELRQSPFQSAWMFYPLGVNLVFYTLTTLNGILSIPIQLAFGVVPANSFIIYFELVMAGLGMWLLMRRIFAYHTDAAPFSRRGRDGLALLAAILYAYSSSKWVYLSLGQFNIAASHWLPWALLYLTRMWNAPTLRRAAREAALCAFFALCLGWTEFTYASFFIQIAALLYGWLALATVKNGDWARLRRFTAACVLLALLFLGGMFPILQEMIAELRVSGDFLVEGLGFSNVFSNDVLGFVVPSEQHPLFGEWALEQFDFAYLNFAFVGWSTLILSGLALLSRKTRPQAQYWVLFALIFGLLSLGPTLRVNGGEWDLPMPFDVLLQIPILKANRYPSRYSVMIMLCLGIAATWGVAALLTWARAREGRWGNVAALAIGALMLVEHIGAPLPLSDYRTPAIYEALAARPGVTVLDIPLAWRNGFRVTGTQHPAFMFAQAHQTHHAKRLLSGNTSRNPELQFQYFTEMPVINSLIALETGNTLPAGRTVADSAIAPELLRLLDIQDVVVRRLDDESGGITPEATIPYLEEILPFERWYEDEEYIGASAGHATAPPRYAWDAHHPLARLFFAEGWSALPPLDGDSREYPTAMRVEQPEARILLPSIEGAEAWTLTFTVTVAGDTPVTLLMQSVNGGAQLPVAEITLTGATRAYTVTIPANRMRGELTNLWLRFDGAPYRPAGDTLLVESAALSVGDFAHIYWNGQELGGTATGYYAALFRAGQIIEARHFDTFNDPNASTALAAFLNEAETGTTLALAGADAVSASDGTGGLRLGDEVWAALKEYGATDVSDMRGRYGWSHAFIGTKGGSDAAHEDSSAIRPARVFLGAPTRSAEIYAEFDGFQLTPAP